MYLYSIQTRILPYRGPDGRRSLIAAAAPLAGTLSDPLAAPGGWVGALAPRGAAPRSRASAALEMQARRARQAWGDIR